MKGVQGAPDPSDPPSRPTLVVLATVAALVPLLALGPCRRLESKRERLRIILAESGVAEEHAETLEDLARETDPVRCQLLVARALLATSLDRLGRLEGPIEPATIEQLAGSFTLARQLAEEAIPNRPAAWQGYLIVGAATYLEWSLRRDRRIATEAAKWEVPLLQAVELAPSQAEPKRFLTLAYLEMWPHLSAEKQALARETVVMALEDRKLFPRILPRWLDVAPDLDQAMNAVPDEPWAWLSVQSSLAQRGEWVHFVRARERWEAALSKELREGLAAADRRLSRWDTAGARRLLMALARQLPLERRWSAGMARILELMPPGRVRQRDVAPFGAWLEWSLELCRWDECPLPGGSLKRLVRLIGELPESTQAEALLAAGDLAGAEALERTAANAFTDDWTDYWIDKVPHHLVRGELEGAEQALSHVGRAHRSEYRYLEALRALRAASGDAPAASALADQTANEQRSEWPASTWQQSGRQTHRLFAVSSAPCSGFEIELSTGAPGAAVEVLANGRLLSVATVPAGTSTLRLAVALDAGPHLLDVVALAGRVTPGPVRLAS